MRSTRQNSLHAPSVRTSSSHRSTIEPRGVPEFDRDYAKQLSVAKRGRSGSVRPSPRTGSADESSQEETGIGHFPGSAAAAANRIKDYVATHVTPPRPFHAGTPVRPSPEPSSVNHMTSSAVKTPPPAPITKTSSGGAAASPSPKPFLAGASTPLAYDEGVGGSDSPPSIASLNSTRRGSTEPLQNGVRSGGSSEGTLKMVLMTFAISAVALFLVLCTLSFFVSSDRDYNAAYFSFFGSGGSQAAAQQRVGKAAPRSFPDRIIPQLNRQLALHTRRLLGQFVDFIGVMRGVRFVGHALHSTTRPFTFLWSVLKEGIISPLVMVFPRIDVSVHPTLRYVFAASTEAAEGWSVSKSRAVLGSIARSLMQVVEQPIYIVGRTLHAIGSGLSQSVQLFSVPLVGHNVSTAGAIAPRSNITAAAKAFNRTGRTSTVSRAAASMVLGMWRPLHRLWSVVLPLTEESVAPHHNHTIAPPHRKLSEAVVHTAATLPPTEEPTEERKQESAAVKQADAPLRTTHSRRLRGELWVTFLDKDRETLLRLAQEDLQAILGADVVVENVQLRHGSLVVDFAVVAHVAAEEGSMAAEWLHATQQRRDEQVQQGHFSRLQAYYDDAAAAVKRDRETAASASAAADCEERVSACTAASAEAQRACETAQSTAAVEAESALQACQSAEAACWLNATGCAAKVAEAERRLAARDDEAREQVGALAAAKRALAAATVAHVNASQAERHRWCALRLEEVEANCTAAMEKTRAAVTAEGVAKTQESVAAVQRAAQEDCTDRLASQKRNFDEQHAVALRQAEAACEERLARRVETLNHSSQAAVQDLQHTLNSTAADAARRLATCEGSSNQTMTRWQAERAEAAAACSAQLDEARHSCEASEQHSAEEACTARVGAVTEQLFTSCNASVRQAWTSCEEKRAQEAAALSASAAVTLAQLRETSEAATREAEARVAACVAQRDTERAASMAAQRQLNESCAAQRTELHEQCSAMLQKELEAERVALHRIADDNWTRQADLLTTQCRDDTRRAVANAAAALELQHTAALETATAAVRRQAAEDLDGERETARRAEKAALQRHEEEVHSCETRVADCMADTKTAVAAQAKAADEARLQLIAYLSETGEQACRRVTRDDARGCAGERQRIEAALQALPAGATLLEVLKSIHAGSGGAAPSGQLTWNFSNSGLSSLVLAPSHERRGVPSWLHVTGMVVGLASAAYALLRRQRDRRLYSDTMAQLNALIAANETTREVRSPLPPRPRRGRLGSAADAFADGAPVSWAAVATSLASSTDALTSWHATCCALYFEQASAAVAAQRQQRQNTTQSSLLTNIVSPPTLPLHDTDASLEKDASSRALTHMHDAFVGTYFNILEMYYVDLLNAVANRELAESQLQDTEALAARQAAILHKQSAAVAQLKKALAEKEREQGGGGNRLAREERRTAAQQAMISLLEGQLKVSKEELDHARGVVQTPARTPRSEGGAESSSAKQVRSLQQLANDEQESTNSSDFSHHNRRPSPRQVTGAASTTSHVARGTHTEEPPRSTPTSAMKKPASMVRDPESTRRYQKLRWNDEAGAQ